MKVKLGNEVIDVWQISLNPPEEQERWVLHEFEKGNIIWSGILTKQKLAERDWSKCEGKIWEDWRWALSYVDIKSCFRAFVPYDLFLVVSQYNFPSFGKIGEYLVQVPELGLQIYSEKEFDKYSKFLQKN